MAADLDQPGYFEPIARLPGCPACSDPHEAPPLVDAIYCIALQEEEARAQEAAAHFHAIGLCRHVTFYRPKRGLEVSMATWKSHREVARHALAQNQSKVLILEDDVQFTTDWRTVSARAARAMTRLPKSWWCFFLGHWPVQFYFIASDVVRTRSTCAHAYIANRPLLEWIAHSKPLDPVVPMFWPAATIDGAMLNLPDMYALFPMVATQRPPATFRHDHRIKGLFEFDRHRNWIIYRAMRPVQFAAVLAWPVNWALLRLRGFGVDQMPRIETAMSRAAKRIRASGLFDDEYYLSIYFDIDFDVTHPLFHYMTDGCREGREGHPLFDTKYYWQQVGGAPDAADNAIIHYLDAKPETRRDPHPCFDGAWYRAQLPNGDTEGKAPLVHYLQAQPATRKNPHRFFDEAWYLASYRDAAASGEAGLAHYLKSGWKDGRRPHPRFDVQRYMAENPDVAAAGANPFHHYIRHGRGEGRARWFEASAE